MKRFHQSEEGATSVEYAVALAAVFLAVIATVVIVGNSLNSSFGSSSQEMLNFFP